MKIPEHMVVHLSPGRCGSTLISQIMRDLFGVKNVKATDQLIGRHPDKKIVMTHRDFRWCFVSWWRLRCAGNDDEVIGGRKVAESEVPKIMDLTLKTCGKFKTNHKNNKHALVLAYDDFYNNYEYIYDRFEEYFGFDLSRSERDRLTDEYSLSKNKDRASKMKSFNKWDDKFIHGRHIFKDGQYDWRELVGSDELADYIEGLLMPHLKYWGYE